MSQPSKIFKTTFTQKNTTLSEYINRTKKYIILTEEDFCIVAVILDFICEKYKNINPSMYYKLYACALIICIKMYDDNLKTNKFYSYVFGIPLHIFNALELEFLDMINWHVNVTIDQYNENVKWLENNEHDHNKLIETVFLKNALVENDI